MKKTIQLANELLCEETTYSHYFKCPGCKTEEIKAHHKYCPMCGVEIEFE